MEQNKHIRIGQSTQTKGKCPRNGTKIKQSCEEPLIHTLRNHIKPLNLKPYYIHK